MSPLPLAALLLFGAGPATAACLDAAQGRALVAKLRRAAVRTRAQADDSKGSGFFLRDASGVSYVTAHHVVGKGDPGSCTDRDEKAPPPVSDRLTLSRLRANSPGHAGRTFGFEVEPGRFDYGNDAVTTPSESAEALEPGAFPLRPGEKVLVAGYPDGGAFTAHLCEFAGYMESATDQANAAYVLDCPRLRTDIAGMSGGPIVSLCSGKVVGIVSTQDYDERCPREGDARKVGAVIVSTGRDGRVAFGAQGVVDGATCWSSGPPPRSRLDVRRPCQVIPGYYNVTYGP